MKAVVVLEWAFSPPDYFGEAIEISQQDFTMTIADGIVQAKIDSATYEADPNMRQELHDYLNNMFFGKHFFTRRDFELLSSKMTRVQLDRQREFVMYADPGQYKICGKTVDFEVIDKDGNVISDSKRFMELVSSHYPTDATLASLLRSYYVAERNPTNELVHLYEIRDALIKKFGNKKSALSSLKISSSQWSRFGKLCNEEPLRQGRHVGRAGPELRDATEGELTEAREIARAMIEAYRNNLETSTGP